MSQKLSKKCDRFTKRWSDLFSWVAVVAIAAMLGITVVDIIGSKLFGKPLLGSGDIIGLLGLIVAAFAIAQTEIYRQHVRIDFIIVLFKKRIQAIIGIVSSLIALIFIGLLVWKSVDYGIYMQASKIGSPTLRIAFFPFGYLIALSCIPLFLILLLEFLESIRKARKNESD